MISKSLNLKNEQFKINTLNLVAIKTHLVIKEPIKNTSSLQSIESLYYPINTILIKTALRFEYEAVTKRDNNQSSINVTGVCQFYSPLSADNELEWKLARYQERSNIEFQFINKNTNNDINDIIDKK